MKGNSRCAARAVAAFILAVAIVVIGGSARAAIISPGDPLIPSGLGPGDSFQLVFVTSTKTNREDTPGSGTDTHPISFWDDYVNTVADGSSLAGVADLTWYAMASTTTVAARDHALVSAPVYRTDGELVATGFTDMWDGGIAINIDIDESGAAVNLSGSYGSGREVWTGDASNYSSAGVIGASPLGNGSAIAQTGQASSLDGGWHSYGAHIRRGVTDARRFYALSEVITVASEVPEPSTFVLIASGLVALARFGRRRRRRL